MTATARPVWYDAFILAGEIQPLDGDGAGEASLRRLRLSC
jgi:hypothetical protein